MGWFIRLRVSLISTFEVIKSSFSQLGTLSKNLSVCHTTKVTGKKKSKILKKYSKIFLELFMEKALFSKVIPTSI